MFDIIGDYANARIGAGVALENLGEFDKLVDDPPRLPYEPPKLKSISPKLELYPILLSS